MPTPSLILQQLTRKDSVISNFRISLTIFIATAISLTPLGVFADSHTRDSIVMTPATERYELNAGATRQGKMTVINDGSKDFTFTVSTSPFSVEGEEYKQNFSQKGSKLDPSKWFSFPVSKYSLKAGQRVDVPYTINVPANAPSGGHYAVVFAETLPESSGNITRKKRVGSIFYLTVNGNIERKGQLDAFDVEFWQTKAPLISELRLENSGNVHFTQKTDLVITDAFGRTKARIQDESIVLPDTIKLISLKWNEAPSFGIFRVGGVVNIGDNQEILPTKTVLMLSAPMFILFAIIFSLIIAFSIYVARRK